MIKVPKDAETKTEVMVKTELGFEVKQESHDDAMWASKLVTVPQNFQAGYDCETKCLSCDDKENEIAVMVFGKG